MKNFSIVGLRLLAIWAFINATIYAQHLPAYFMLPDDLISVSGIGILLPFSLYLVISIILYYKAPIVAEKITSGFANEEVPEFDYQKLAAVLFSSAGLLIFFWAMESFIQSIGSIYHYRLMDPQNPDRVWRELGLLTFGGVIQMVVGITLFTGGKKLSIWWEKFRDWS